MPTFKKIKVEDFEAEALPHLNNLFRTAVRLTNNRSEAEDLIQEVYMQAWKSFACFEPGTNCRAWLFKILSNKFRHHRQKKNAFKCVEDSDKVFDTLAYQSPIPERLSNEELLVSLARIPLCYREVVLLADVEEFSYKEVASILSIPIGTVMSRLSRGRKLLRTELTQVAGSCGFKRSGKEESRSLVKFFLSRLKPA